MPNITNIPYSRWYSAINQRRSRRQYNPKKPIPDHVLSELQAVCTEFKPFLNIRAELVTRSCSEVFKGAVGSYGKIKCAQAFVAFIGNTSDKNVQEKVGYIGEAVILEATTLQLATCWVAGFFRPEVVAQLISLNEKERVLGVTPIGYAEEKESFEERIMTGFGLTHRRKPLSSLTSGLDVDKWPEWVAKSLEAARLAPSAINRQPWGFHVDSEAITISIKTKGLEFNISKRLDCGIAMLHIDAAAVSCGVFGKWEFLNSPLVACFKANTSSQKH
jgi:nitroreductase